MRQTTLIALTILLLAACTTAPERPAPGNPDARPVDEAVGEAIVEDFLAVPVPPDDAYEWAARDGRIAWDAPRTVVPSRAYQVGDIASFTVGREDLTVAAALAAVGEHAYFWVEVGQPVDVDAYDRAARLFDQVYPIAHRYFGSEWSPGVDGDPRIFILHTTLLEESIGGFAVPFDQLTRDINPPSNEHEMIYMSIGASSDQVGSDGYIGLLTHEFQHMIQANTDPNESNWVDEGLSQMASFLTGYPGYAPQAYLDNTDVPLGFWDRYAEDIVPYYGANFLFWLYLWEQFGDDFFIQAAQSPREGLVAIDETLAARGEGRSLDEVFADWTVANLVDDRSIDDGRYGYDSIAVGTVNPLLSPSTVRSVPHAYSIDQFTPHYLLIGGEGSYSIDFSGRTEASFVPTQAYSGRGFWWSNRRDGSHTRLMRTFDLTDLSSATLQYAIWYNLEVDCGEMFIPASSDGGITCDVMYVSASTDGGSTWDTLRGQHMTGSAGGANLPAYTGSSGGWLTDQIDLTPYAGGSVLVSFDYRTNLIYVLDGVALDDVQVPELGFTDNAEVADPGWQTEGWIHTDNSIPQHWGLYVVTRGEPATVTPVPVVDGRAHVAGDFPPDGSSIVLVIAASAPCAGVPSEYTLSFAD